MAHSMHVFCIDLDRVRSFCGSKNDTVLVDIEAVEGSRVSRREAVLANRGGPGSLKLRAAIAQIVYGEELEPRFGPIYGHAFECLCILHGAPLPNEGWFGIARAKIDDFVRYLHTLHVGQPLEALLHRGAPVELPPSEDVPFIGYLTAAEVKFAHEQLCMLNQAGPSELQTVFASYRRWMGTAAGCNLGLVSFYY